MLTIKGGAQLFEKQGRRPGHKSGGSIPQAFAKADPSGPEPDTDPVDNGVENPEKAAKNNDQKRRGHGNIEIELRNPARVVPQPPYQYEGENQGQSQ